MTKGELIIAREKAKLEHDKKMEQMRFEFEMKQLQRKHELEMLKLRGGWLGKIFGCS